MANDLSKSALGEEIQRIDPELLKGLNKDKRERLAKALFKIEQTYTLSVQQETHHSGPLPHPETLAQYEEIIPNGAERIMAMAEKQSAHRIELESMVVKSQVDQSARGTIYCWRIGATAHRSRRLGIRY